MRSRRQHVLLGLTSLWNVKALHSICPLSHPLFNRCGHSIRTRISVYGTASNDAETHFDGPQVWIQEAEEDFVDEEENLEPGEVCLAAFKAFATSDPASTSPAIREPRFLCAGALIQRPPESPVCDAWTADSILTEGGPNLQIQGALQILDKLLLFHLQHQGGKEKSIHALQTFVIKCGEEENGDNNEDFSIYSNNRSTTTCASLMAAKARGFRPLRELVRTSSIYSASLYDNDLDGFVLDVWRGKERYQELMESETVLPSPEASSFESTVAAIFCLLPGDDVIRRNTFKRFSAK